MNPASHNDNTKKILRVALVGIRPADQVILKGYLRLLMRLEVDLEWVSANHEAVDLFMINSEFQHAESVQRLLVMHPNSSVLYISRTETENGFLAGNLLTLPIKDLDPLNQWLYANLRILFSKNPPKMSGSATNNTANISQAPTKRQSLDDLLASRQNQSSAVQQKINDTPISTGISLDAIQKDKNALLALAKVITRLSKKEASLFSLNEKNGMLLAYIHPSKQLIWQVKPLTEIGEWTLNLANPTTAPLEKPEDLVQFFWKFGLKNAKFLEPMLNIHRQYRIGSWVKPEHNSQQNHVLKIQCILEARLATLYEIKQLTEIDEKTVQEILVALILSGVMHDDVYQSLNQTVLESDKYKTESVTINPITPTPSALPTSQVTAQLQQEMNAEESKASKNESSMRGFLSRLRSKLGI